MFFQGEVLNLLRYPVCPTLFEIVHPLQNFVVFLELLLEEGVDIADGLDISVFIVFSSGVLDLLVVMQFKLAEDIFRVRIVNKCILFGGN